MVGNRLGDWRVIAGETFDGVLVAVSQRQDDSPKSLLAKTLDFYAPTEVVLFVTDAVRESKADRMAGKLCDDRGMVAHQYRLAGDAFLNPEEVESAASSMIKRLKKSCDKILVDITGGTSSMSVGMYQAAVNNEVTVGYANTPPGAQTEPRLIYSPKKS